MGLARGLVLGTVHAVALARDAFFSPDLPAESLAHHVARLQPESLRVALDGLRRQLGCTVVREERPGLSHARNRGAAVATGDILCVIDVERVSWC